MHDLQGKSIILGVGAGISAYRSLEFIRLMRKAGASVRVMPTPNALQFVGELSFEALSGQPCLVNPFELHAGQISHIEEAYKADAIVVAPATCDLIAKMANGFADNLILQTLLSFRGPCLIAPAMESLMWEHEATQKNVTTLSERGCVIVGPNAGSLASGRNGIGRMAEPEEILERLFCALSPQDFAGRRVLVTAGPTVEDIDPVRFISNRSSGKMGVAIARALAHRGAEVHLVHGPMSTRVPPLPNIECHPVRSASQMLDRVLDRVENCDTAILCAAVADFTPLETQTSKIKKSSSAIEQLSLSKTKDILATLGRLEHRPILVGFAAETENLEDAAFRKCREKNCDLICGNLVGGDTGGFDSDLNQVLIVDRHGNTTLLEQAFKSAIAHQILDAIARIDTSLNKARATVNQPRIDLNEVGPLV